MFGRKKKRPLGKRIPMALPAISLPLLMRLVLFGIVAILGALYALVHHYTRTAPPLRNPPANVWGDAGEVIPVEPE